MRNVITGSHILDNFTLKRIINLRMHYQSLFNFYTGFQFGPAGFVFTLIFAAWELGWKGFGLWKAAKNNQSGWFVAILLLNTVGILPLLYIYVFSPKPSNKI